MLENKKYMENEIGSEKGFGFVFTIFFLIVCFYPIYFGNNINEWALYFSLTLFFITIVKPNLFKYPNKIWFKFSILLGSIVSPFVMGLIFFLTISPFGIIFRLINKDLLNQKIYKSKKTYWITRNKNLQSMKNQY